MYKSLIQKYNYKHRNDIRKKEIKQIMNNLKLAMEEERYNSINIYLDEIKNNTNNKIVKNFNDKIEYKKEIKKIKKVVPNRKRSARYMLLNKDLESYNSRMSFYTNVVKLEKKFKRSDY